MSYEKVRAYFEHAGLADRITLHQQSGDTVEHAAETIGCTPAEIAKAMTFQTSGGPVIIVMAGDARVNSSKFKARFQQKPTMIPFEQVEALTGHAPGGVCPFAVREGMSVYLDVSLKRFSVIHTAGGVDTATIRLTLRELEEHSHSDGWVDVCKGWLANGDAVQPA